MSSVITKTGAIEVIFVGPIVNTSSVALTGLTTIKTAVVRASDRKFLDWSTLAFTTTPVTPYFALTELDATNAPGVYYVAIDTSTFVGATAKDKYFAYVSQQGASTAANALQLGEFRIGEIVDNVENNLAISATNFTGTASAGATSTITLAGGSAIDDLYKFSDIEITSGTGKSQTRSVLLYAGSTKVATVNRPWVTTPDNTSVFAIRARTQPIIVDAAMATAGSSSSITFSAGSSATTDYYAGLTVEIAAGTGLGQARVVIAYNGSTKVATLASAWATQPDNTSLYVLLPVGRSIVVSNLDKAGYSLLAGSLALSTFAANAIDSTVLAANAIGASQIAANAITAAKVATDAIGAAQLATDAVVEIATGVLSTVVPGAFAVNTLGARIGSFLLSPTAILTGTASAGTSTSITLTGGSAVANTYRYSLILITGGTGAGQTSTIIDYTSAGVASVARNWITTPDNTSTFAVIQDAQPLIVTSGILQSATSTTATLATVATVATNSFYNGSLLFIRGGTGAGQARLITSYVGATFVATLDEAWTTTPDATSGYEILPMGRVRVATVEPAAVTSITTGIALTTDVTTSTSTVLAAIPSAATNATTLLDQALAGHTNVGSAGKALSNVDAASSTLAVPGSAMTLTAGALTAVQGKILSDATPFAGANIDAQVSTRLPTSSYVTPPTAAANASALLGTSVPGAFAAGTVGFNLDVAISTRLAGSSYTVAPTVTQIWQTALPGAFIAGQAGFILGTNLDALVSTRLATSGYTAPPTASVIATNVWQTALPGAFASGQAGNLLGNYTAAPTAVANASAVWTQALPGLFASGSAGFIVGTNIDALTSSRLAASGYTAPPTSAANATAIWTQALPGAFAGGSAGSIVGTNLDTNVASRLSASSYAAPPGPTVVAAAVWDELTASSGTANSFGALVKVQLDTNIASRMATFVYTTPPTAVAISTQVRADIITDHGSGSYTTATGFSTLTASQVWTTVVPGAFTSGQAGNVLGNVATGTPPTAAAISAQVNSDLSTAHGAGSYQTATGFATSSALTTAQGDITAIKGAGFVGGTDDLHTAHGLLAAAATGAALASAITTIDTNTNSAVAPLATTTALAAVQTDTTAIKGAGFVAGTDDLHTAHGLLTGAATGAALTTAVTTIDAHTDVAVAPLATSANVTSAISTIDANTNSAVAPLATSSALTTAQADITAIKGTGFVGGTDDLHTAHGLLAGAATGAALTTAVSTIDTHTDAAVAPLATSANVTSAVTTIDAHTDAAVVPLATSTALAAVQADTTAIKGSGFVGGTDDLHSAHTLLAATATGAALTTAVSTIDTNTNSAVAPLATSAALTAAITTIDANTNSATSPLATSAALTTAQTDLTAIKGSSFVGGTDDLHSAHALLAATATGAALLTAVTTIDAHTDTAVAPLATSVNVTTSTTAVNAHTDVATSPLATGAALTTAQGDLTAIKGAGFVGGTDDLHSAHALLTGAATGSALTAAVIAIDAHTDAAVAPLATTANVNSAVTTIDAHTDSVTSPLATSAALTTAQGDLTAIKGAGFVGGTDDLHSAHTLLAATATGAALTTAVSTIDTNTNSAVAPLATSAALATAVTTIDTNTNTAVSTLATSAALATAQTSINTANTSLAAIEGPGFVGGTDDLHTLHALTAGAATSASLAAAVSTIDAHTDNAVAPLATAVNLAAAKTAIDAANTTLGAKASQASVDALAVSIAKLPSATILGSFTIAVGSTSMSLNTDATQPDAFFDGAMAVVVHATGVASGLITFYQNTSGNFALESALPFTPTAGDKVHVVPRESDIVAITGAITAAAGGINTHTDDATRLPNDLANALGAGNKAHVLTGSTTTTINTDINAIIAQDGSSVYNGMILVIVRVNGETVGRKIVTYASSGGVFTVTPALLFAPDISDIAFVIPLPAGASLLDVNAATAAVIVAPNGIGVTSIATDAITAPAVSAAAVTKIQSGITATVGPVTLQPGALTSTAIGAGFVGAVQSGLATATNLASLATNVAAIPAATWATMLPGSFTTGSAGALLALAGALAPPNVSAIVAGVWGASEGTPSAGTYGYGLKLLRMLTTNRVEETAGNPGHVSVYADDAATVFLTWPLRDGSGNAVTLTAGEPARRGAGS